MKVNYFNNNNILATKNLDFFDKAEISNYSCAVSKEDSAAIAAEKQLIFNERREAVYAALILSPRRSTSSPTWKS